MVMYAYNIIIINSGGVEHPGLQKLRLKLFCLGLQLSYFRCIKSRLQQ